METNNLSEKRMLGFRAVCLPNGHEISDDRAVGSNQAVRA